MTIDNLIVVMMQRNEGELFSLWIAFYEKIVPLKRIYVIDNGSDDDVTLEILSRHEARGLNVIRCFQSIEDFARKGAIVQSVIEAAGVAGRFALPCDCDELLYVRTTEGPSVKSKDIARHLRALARRDDKTAIRIGEQYYNIPNSVAGYKQQCKKLLFRERIPEALDNGYHYYSFAEKVSIVPDIGKSRLGYLHLHNKPFGALVASARRKIDSRSDSIRSSREGRHLLHYLNMSETDYIRSFSERPADISIDAILSSVGLALPSGF